MISHAIVIGRSHRLMQQNCHDFALSGTAAPDCAFGLVLDGCGSKHRDESGMTPSHNEVGAKLLGQFVAAYLTTHLPHNSPNEAFLTDLYSACRNFLQDILTLLPTTDPVAQTRFIATHLLCTLVGFVMKEATAVFFWSGDGYFGCNGKITQLDNSNQPDYLAYQLGRRAEEQKSRGENLQSPEAKRPNLPTFQSCTVHNPHWLAVASDGWAANLLTQLDSPQSSLALQRWLNVQAKERGTFEDDGAIAIWWKPKSENSEKGLLQDT